MTTLTRGVRAEPAAPASWTPPPADGTVTRRPVATAVAVWLAYWVLALGLQVASGAHTSGFGTISDEAAHYVTGLMVRDYLASGWPEHPVRYAENYYLHYPKVALGQWPPMFYLLQAVWTLPFGGSRLVVLLGMASLAALVGTIVYRALVPHVGLVLSLAGGALFLLFPLTQEYAAAVMTEIPVALFALAAALMFGRYVEGGRPRHVYAFALLAAAAILVKGSGFALALVPPLTVLVTGRWRVLRQPHLWLAGALVAVLCVPWYWVTTDMVSGTWVGGSSPTLAYTLHAAPSYARWLAGAGGVFVLVAALVGLATARWRQPGAGAVAATGALAVAVLVLHSVIPSSLEPRNLLPVLPPLAIFATLGLAALARRARALGSRPWVAAAILLAVFGLERFDLYQKSWHGYQEVAALMAADERLQDAVTLVSADSIGEGLLVSEVAMRDHPRPGHLVLRGSKILARSDWLGRGYESYFDEPGALLAYLDTLPVTAVVIDTSVPAPERDLHERLVQQALDMAGRRWERVGSYDVVRRGTRHPAALAVYVRNGELPRPPHRLTFDEASGRRRIASTPP
jgi:hypothetical protein